MTKTKIYKFLWETSHTPFTDCQKGFLVFVYIIFSPILIPIYLIQRLFSEFGKLFKQKVIEEEEEEYKTYY